MTPLTQLQRYTAYCIMREEAENGSPIDILGYDPNMTNGAGFCFLALALFGLRIYGEIDLHFPELYARKPAIEYTLSQWFSKGDWTERIKILDACISETEPR